MEVMMFLVILVISFTSRASNETDRLALFQFRAAISGDLLNSWNHSTHFCQWQGVTCSPEAGSQRVSGLNLKALGLCGQISPHIANLTYLRFINLNKNSFSGEIPSQLGRLSTLQHLNLSLNALEGRIPVNLTNCADLRVLTLGANRLIGTIPSELASLTNLVHLRLGSNILTGPLPPHLGNISALGGFDVGDNHLTGTLPHELGRFPRLMHLRVTSNNLFGNVPLSLFNMSTLQTCVLAQNTFTGSLPSNIGLTLPNLLHLGIGINQFSGTIPISFSNASRLQILDISSNRIVGQVPTSFGELANLERLYLGNNSLGSYSTNSLDFISSLTNCSQMTTLDLSWNNFAGVLPKSVANLSTRITTLHFGFNHISGNIPETLENFANLISLAMLRNHFSGIILPSFCKLTKLQVVDLSWNKLSGNIPSCIGNLTRISQLDLSNNIFEGSIPKNISACQSLQLLHVSNNGLTGAIPANSFSLLSILWLDWSRNSFVGSLPAEVGKLRHINALDLSENNLTGEIPETIRGCEALEILYLEENSFNGTLPTALAYLKGLQFLDLSGNKFTGHIPTGLEKLPSLVYLNLSFNELEGQVPVTGVFQGSSSQVSVAGNPKLCGGVETLRLPNCLSEEGSRHRNARSNKKLITIIAFSVAALLLLFASFFVFYWRKRPTREPSLSSPTFRSLPRVSYKSVHEATDGFSPSMLIGAGSFGSVFRGVIDSSLVAVKVFNLKRKGASESFTVECNALTMVRHRNIVKVLTCCSSIDHSGNEFKALIFEYMPNGSLDKWLNAGLNVAQRLNIAIDVALAVDYLHHHCDPPVIHCDLKPENVLLDHAMVARVCDFGVAKLISVSETQTSSMGIRGTVGYAAPEYAMGGEASREGDVYSFGIVLLEMFTGRRPTEQDGDLNLHNYAKTKRALGERESVLEIGVACSVESPSQRMSLRDAITKLQCLRNACVA